MTPAEQPSSRTAKATIGVATSVSYKYARTPSAAKISAESLAKTSEFFLASNPITQLGSSKFAFRYLAIPTAA
ncbi:unannotated protein [freshwater metagenome]|uniref:Unannotated protein n=1 Tax=freshwater metagenome TaxID=449393 RepID=A0A6J6JJB0_9ZZZZ